MGEGLLLYSLCVGDSGTLHKRLNLVGVLFAFSKLSAKIEIIACRIGFSCCAKYENRRVNK